MLKRLSVFGLCLISLTCSAAPEPGAWKTDPIQKKNSPSQTSIQVQAVRFGHHEGYDRAVFEFKGSSLPSYDIQYTDQPPSHCASGNPVPIAGKYWLQVRFQPAAAHTEAGETTLASLEASPKLPVIEAAKQTCDFEGQVEWNLGTRARQPYRLLELSAPTRLVLDLRQP